MDIYRPCLDNKELLDTYLRYNDYPGCELSAANNILWSQYYDIGFTIVHDMLVFCKLQEGSPTMFSFPIGKGDAKAAFDEITRYFQDNKLQFSMYLVQEKMFELIESWYPGMYNIEFCRDDADYLYEYKTLSELKGKKLHGKRNHINRFEGNYPNYEYEEIGQDNYKDCIAFAIDWEKQNNTENDKSKEYERDIIVKALENRDVLGLVGGLIRVEGSVVAFTMGEPLTKNTFVVHFEKACADVQGAYPMINREFVRRQLKGYDYINREEDLGIPGLRHAKTSYQPIRLVEKGIVTLK